MQTVTEHLSLLNSSVSTGDADRRFISGTKQKRILPVVDLTFHTNDAGVGGRYYADLGEALILHLDFEAVKSNYKSSGDIASSASVQLTDVAYDTASKVVVYAENSKGLEAVAPLVLTLKAKASTPTEAPATTTPTPTTRATINPSVSESKVTGLEKALAFYPKQMYNFTVTGAGTDNTNPIKGDQVDPVWLEHVREEH